MKKQLSMTVFILLCCACAVAQTDRGTASLDLGGGKVSVDYGRPSFRGRDIESSLPVGTEWRMGMNGATTLTTDVDLKFDDKVVPKGKYTLSTKRADAQKWMMLIKGEDGTVVAETPLTFQKVGTSTELMTIELTKKGSGANFNLLWGNYSLSTDFAKAGGTQHGAMQSGGEIWKELDAFHEVMAATFHPMEEGDFKPVRNRASEMMTKAKQWAASKPPKSLDTSKIKESLAKLLRDSQALELMVKKNAKDDKIKIALTALHEQFHEIVGLCSESKVS